MADSPELAAAKRLLDTAKHDGFVFQRVAPGDDGPLLGTREGADYRDTCYLGGFSDYCHAIRTRKSRLVIPGALPITERVSGDALTVLQTVLFDWPT